MQSCFLERLGASQKDGANIHLPAFCPLEKRQGAPGNMPQSLDPGGALISGPQGCAEEELMLSLRDLGQGRAPEFHSCCRSRGLGPDAPAATCLSFTFFTKRKVPTPGGNGEGAPGWLLGEGPVLSLGELSRIPGVPKQSRAGPKAPLPVGLLQKKKALGEPPWQGVPELVLKAQLGADKAPRHKGTTGWGGGRGSLQAECQGHKRTQDRPRLTGVGLSTARTASANTSLTPSCCRAEHSR